MNLPSAIQLPLVLAVVMAAYLVGAWLYERARRSPFLHPVLVATALTAASLAVLGIPREHFIANVAMIDMLLGPAVVALAVPLYDNMRAVRTAVIAVIAAVLICGALIVATTLCIHLALGLEHLDALSLSLRSITAPVAVAIAQSVRLVPELTMLAVFVTGLVAVIVTPLILSAMRIDDDATMGFTLGVTAHTFGIAKALERSPRAAAFATAGMGLTAATAAVAVPWIL